MGNETKRAAPSDEDLGAALRKIATVLGHDDESFSYSDAVDRCGMTPATGVQQRWEKLVWGDRG